MKTKEIAAAVDAHLKRFEADPAINKYHDGRGTRPYFNSFAVDSGRFVHVTYVSYQGASTLSKGDAERYLAALGSGFVGKHFHAPLITTPDPSP